MLKPLDEKKITLYYSYVVYHFKEKKPQNKKAILFIVYTTIKLLKPNYLLQIIIYFKQYILLC